MSAQSNSEDQTRQESGTLIYREKVPNTPFHIVGDTEKGYFIAMANWKVSETKSTIAECEIDVEAKDWRLITNVIITLAKIVLETDMKDFKDWNEQRTKVHDITTDN